MKHRYNAAYISHFSDLHMGGQRSMTFLIENLDRDRVNPCAIMPEAGELSERLEKCGCPCYFIPLFSIKPKYLTKLPHEYKMLRNLIREKNIDILHPDYPSDAYMCYLAKSGTDAKLFWHVRWNEKFTKDKLYEKIADGIICVSKGTRDRFSYTPEIDAKTAIIFNGVDCSVFSPVDDRKAVRKALEIPNDRNVGIFVGVYKDGKGVFDIINALGIIKKMREDIMPNFYFIGTPMDTNMSGIMENMIRANDLNAYVKLIPQQNNIYEWMQAADFLTIPSYEGHEGMPRVLYEAMACGAVGIGSDTSGVREALTKESGILVPEKSPEQLADAILKIIENPELMHSYQIEGRKRAVSTFDIKIHSRNVVNFYDKICGY